MAWIECAGKDQDKKPRTMQCVFPRFQLRSGGSPFSRQKLGVNWEQVVSGLS